MLAACPEGSDRRRNSVGSFPAARQTGPETAKNAEVSMVSPELQARSELLHDGSSGDRREALCGRTVGPEKEVQSAVENINEKKTPA